MSCPASRDRAAEAVAGKRCPYFVAGQTVRAALRAAQPLTAGDAKAAGSFLLMVVFFAPVSSGRYPDEEVMNWVRMLLENTCLEADGELFP